DTIELWKNDPATDLTFSPVFTDQSDTLLFSQVHDVVGPGVGNTTPLARALPAGDGSSFNGDGDFFVDVAIPIVALTGNGVLVSPGDLDQALFFPATA